MSDEKMGTRVWIAFGFYFISLGRSPLIRFEKVELFTLGIGFWAAHPDPAALDGEGER